MYYEFRLTTPANTPRSAPIETELQLDEGVVTGVEVLFPPGCVGLVHLQVRRETHQLFPANADADLVGDTFPIRWREELEVGERPYVWTAVAWNDDDSYPHTVTLRLELTPMAIWARSRPAIAALEYLAQWFAQGAAP